MSQATSFGRYRALFRIASGGMAEVHAALHTGEAGFEKIVAVKRILPELADDPRFVHMFLDEARIAATIQSPHVVTTRDVGRAEDGSPYLVMDLVIGVTLAELAFQAQRSGAPLSPRVVVAVLEQIASGLHDVHEAKRVDGERLDLIHRDVSPQNILVGVDGIARLTDFGIAHALFRRTETRAGQLKGKYPYFSPEQAAGKPLDRRCDVFALCIVGWELLAGRPLFDAAEDEALLAQVTSMPIPRLSEVRGDLSPMLVEAIAHGLERSLEARFQTAAELATALRALHRESSDGVGRDELGDVVRAVCGTRVRALEAQLREAAGTPRQASSVVTEVERPSARDLNANRRSDADGPAHAAASAPSRPAGGRRRAVIIAATVGAVAIVGALVFAATRDAQKTSPAGAADPVGKGASDERTRAIAMRACREWARGLAHGQKADGSFAIEPQREPWGFTTAQQLFALVVAHGACGQPGVAPLRSGLAALARLRTDAGWAGDGRVETPATAWAVLAIAAARTTLADPSLQVPLTEARERLLGAQNADGGFRTVPNMTGAPSNAVSTVMALWALTASETLAPDPAATSARERAAGWIRRALDEDLGEPPLRATAGLQEQAVWALRRSRALAGGTDPGDRDRFARTARDVVERCALGADRRCGRAIYEDGQTYLVREEGKPPEFMTLWHPWVTLASGELARDADVVADPSLRAQLGHVAGWASKEIEAAIPALTAAPGYKLAEYLYVVSEMTRK